MAEAGIKAVLVCPRAGPARMGLRTRGGPPQERSPQGRRRTGGMMDAAAGWTKSPRPVLRGRSAAPQRAADRCLQTSNLPIPQLSPKVRVAKPSRGASQTGITSTVVSRAGTLCTWRVKRCLEGGWPLAANSERPKPGLTQRLACPRRCSPDFLNHRYISPLSRHSPNAFIVACSTATVLAECSFWRPACETGAGNAGCGCVG